MIKSNPCIRKSSSMPVRSRMSSAVCVNRLVKRFNRSRFQSVSPVGPKNTRRMLLSTPTTSCPCRSKCSTASEPISPLLPVTSTFIRSNYSLQRVAVQIKLGIAADHIPEMAENWDESAASSLEEYQQSTRFLTVQGEARPQALRGANDFERRACGAQRTFV